MPIEVRDHPPEERAKRRADLRAQADRETLRTIYLPVGRPRRQIEVVREVVRTAKWTDGEPEFVEQVTYYLAGDLELFGCDTFDTIPIIEAVDDADAVRLAEEGVKARWVRECDHADVRAAQLGLPAAEPAPVASDDERQAAELRECVGL